MTGSPTLFLTHGMMGGGAESMLVSLVNGLDRSLCAPVVVSLSGPGELEQRLDHSVRMLHVPRRSRFDSSPSREIARLVRAEGIRSALTLGMFSYLFLRRALRERPSTRVVLSLHTTKPRTIKEFLQSAAYARLVRRADTPVTVCRSQADYLSRLYRIPRARFRTIYNGVDNRRWMPAPASFDREGFRRTLDIPPGVPMILQVAHFRIEKRQEDSVRALAAVHAASPLRPVLVFVGAGEERLRGRAAKTANSLGISPFVRFCGPKADPLPFYWAADLFTLSSRSETFPMTVLEALATGLPSVLTDLGGAREIIEEGVNGAVARPEDPPSLTAAWLRVLEHPGSFDRRRIGEREGERFSLGKCVEAYQLLLCPQGGILEG